MGVAVTIRPAESADFSSIWPIFHAVVSAGDTYGFDSACTEAACQRLWIDTPQKTLVAEAEGDILGTYYLKPNGSGPMAHICNCGYMVAPSARGRGIASQMCRHSQDLARRLGYLAMQFNAVVASNHGAIALWTKLGYATVGRVPGAFRHPIHGLTDTLIMHKRLIAAAPEDRDA